MKTYMSTLMIPLAMNAQTIKELAVSVPAPRPPIIRVADIRSDEKPVNVETSEKTVEENAFFRRVRTCFTFTNPNGRVMSGELEFPIPDEASVCGYALEVNGEMIPGVVCEKEKARVAFENEMRKGVDPGIVEQVKGNIWRTRIFPLNPNTPRKAEVEYVAPVVRRVDDNAPCKNDDSSKDRVCPQSAAGAGCVKAVKAVYEKDDGVVFVAERTAGGSMSIKEKIATFTKGVIAWDASGSAKAHSAEWRKRLEALPENGEWTLLVFRNSAETAAFKDRASLLAAIDALAYDGGTDLSLVSGDVPTLLFTDEIDTLGLDEPKYESQANITIASRDDVRHAILVRKLTDGETPPKDADVKESRLIATVWAARRMKELAGQADARKDEFLALGRKYGVAGPGLSLIVLENLNQWLEHKIEPPESLSFHDEWVKRRAADDDPIAAKKAKAEHEQRLLQYWEERVKWWKDPKPPRKTPKSGLFDRVANAFGSRRNEMEVAGAAMVGSTASAEMASDRSFSRSVAREAPDEGGAVMRSVAAASAPRMKSAKAPGAAGSGTAPTVTLKAWDPKTPYIDALKSADKNEAYSVYLKEREKYAGSPAFYIDCAGWFFKAGEMKLAERIITNLAEFKLEDAALWRTMGWRLREAESYDLAVLAFRKALKLRGEEAQSRRDLALVLMERGKKNLSTADLEESMKLFADAAFSVRTRRSGRRSNDFQVSVVALEELNGLISWIDAREWAKSAKPKAPEFDSAYRRDLPMKLRIVMSWDADETDIDLHVLEPNGEEAFYGHRRTSEGGFVSEDVTTGYGPEEYLKKELETGVYKVLSNYFASHQTALTGATTVTATVYTDWGTAQEKRQVLTLRLDKPKDKHLIGEVKL